MPGLLIPIVSPIVHLAGVCGSFLAVLAVGGGRAFEISWGGAASEWAGVLACTSFRGSAKPPWRLRVVSSAAETPIEYS